MTHKIFYISDDASAATDRYPNLETLRIFSEKKKYIYEKNPKNHQKSPKQTHPFLPLQNDLNTIHGYLNNNLPLFHPFGFELVLRKKKNRKIQFNSSTAKGLTARLTGKFGYM